MNREANARRIVAVPDLVADLDHAILQRDLAFDMLARVRRSRVLALRPEVGVTEDQIESLVPREVLFPGEDQPILSE